MQSEPPAPQQPLLPTDALHEEVVAIVKKKKFEFEGPMYFIGQWAVLGKIKGIDTSLSLSISGIQGPLKAAEEWHLLQNELSNAASKTAHIEVDDYPNYLFGDLIWEKDGQQHSLSERLVSTGLARVCSPCNNLLKLIEIEQSCNPPKWHTEWGSNTTAVIISGRVSSVLSGDFIELTDFTIPSYIDNAIVRSWLSKFQTDVISKNIIRFKIDNIKTPDFSNPLQEHYKIETYQMMSTLALGKIVDCHATTGWSNIETEFDEVAFDLQDIEHLRGAIYIKENYDSSWIRNNISNCTEKSLSAMEQYVDSTSELSIGPFLAAASSVEGESWCELVMPEEFMCSISPDHLSCLLSSSHAGVASHYDRRPEAVKGREGVSHVLTSLKWVLRKTDFGNLIKNKKANIVKLQKEVHEDNEIIKATIAVEYKRTMMPSTTTQHFDQQDDDDDLGDDLRIDPETHLLIEDSSELPVDKHDDHEAANCSSDEDPTEKLPNKATKPTSIEETDESGEEHFFHFNMEVFLVPENTTIDNWKSISLPENTDDKLVPTYVSADFNFLFCDVVSGKLRIFASATDSLKRDVIQTYKPDESYLSVDKQLLHCSKQWMKYESQNLSSFNSNIMAVRIMVRELKPVLSALSNSYYAFSPRIIKPTKNRQMNPRPKKHTFVESIKDFPGKIPRLDHIIFDGFPLNSGLFARSSMPQKDYENSSSDGKWKINFIESGMLNTLCDKVINCYKEETDWKMSFSCSIAADSKKSRNLTVSTRVTGIRKKYLSSEDVLKYDDKSFTETYLHLRVLHKVLSYHHTTQPLWADSDMGKRIEDPMHDPPTLRHKNTSLWCPMKPLVFNDGALFNYESKGLELFKRTENKMQSFQAVSTLYKPRSQGRTTVRIYGGKPTQKSARVPSQVSREHRNAMLHLLHILYQRSIGFPCEGCFFSWHTYPYDRVAAIYLFKRKHLWLRAVEKLSKDFRENWKYEQCDDLYASLISVWENIFNEIASRIYADPQNVDKLINMTVRVTPATPIIDIDLVVHGIDEVIREVREGSPPVSLRIEFPKDGNIKNFTLQWITGVIDEDDEGWEDTSNDGSPDAEDS